MGAREHRVGAFRTVDVEAFGARAGDRRRHHVAVDGTEQTAFTGVRIDPGDRDAAGRRRDGVT